MANGSTLENLLRELASPDEAARKTALLALGREREARSWPAIRRMAASDDAAELRFLAKKVLMFLATALDAPPGAKPGGPAALDAKDPAARIRAANVAAASGATDALPAIRERVGVETDATVRAALATALGALGTRAEIDLLETLASDPDARVRANTIEALEGIGDHSAYPIYVRFVSDKDNRIRANAIRALGALGRANMTKLCLAMIRSRKAWMIESALYLLVPMQAAEAIPAFEELAGHASREIRARARAGLERLVESGNGAAERALARVPKGDGGSSTGDMSMEDVEALARPAGSGDGVAGVEARIATLRGIEAAMDREVLPELLARLEVEESPKVRAVLVRVLGKLGDAGLLPVLEGCLKDEDGRVRANAVEAVAGFITDPEHLKCLEPLLRDDNNRTKCNAVLALWGKVGNGPVQAMKELASSVDKNTRLSAVYAIHQIGEAASSLLTPLVNDTDADVKQKALECRKMLGLETAPEEPVATPRGTPRVTGKQPARQTGKSPAKPADAPPEPPPAPAWHKPAKIFAIVVALAIAIKIAFMLR